MKAFRLLTVVVCVLALLPAGTSAALLATAASTLFESTPFILAGLGIAAVASRWDPRWNAYLGCGCDGGPSARSLPAAAAVWLTFGPIVAVARVLAGALVARYVAPRRHACAPRYRFEALEQLRGLLPFALLTAVALHAFARIDLAHARSGWAFALGALLAFAASPCALGAVGIAAAMHAPFAAGGFLCVNGIVDVRALRWRGVCSHASHDGFAYSMAALACAFVAAHNGAQLVHPRFTVPLWGCTVVFACCAARYRGQAFAPSRWPPALMLCGMLVTSAPPQYRVSETTLADAFAGERVAFTGVVTRDGAAATVVRYAVTCCRADAAPVVLRLESDPRVSGWVNAVGTLQLVRGELALKADRITTVAPPTDPFVYR